MYPSLTGILTYNSHCIGDIVILRGDNRINVIDNSFKESYKTNCTKLNHQLLQTTHSLCIDTFRKENCQNWFHNLLDVI